ncbi:TMEM175 family protein [Actinocrispum wychmicini]|uniref:Putative membrane protein n=1 Tax=Actinocrispum wychmicini TaxID=1213861 RepID=A0A4R2JDX8_9PSEU|nr:TMEM175 family protein [Actinocrispum wychmicini]TCO54998.1 putative membrane protein [Actinocrispum wychmicini]
MATISRDPDRLVLFTDAVAAIAITLLVLPLVDLAREPKAHAIELITENWTPILSFLLSFAVIARLWLVHHRMFQHVRAYTPALVVWNMVWLFTVVVLPFPTEMINQPGSTDPFPPVFYLCTILASSVCQTVLVWIIDRNPDIQVEDNKLKPSAVVSAVSATGLLLAGLILLIAVPQVRYYALLSLLLNRFVVMAVQRLRPT